MKQVADSLPAPEPFEFALDQIPAVVREVAEFFVRQARNLLVVKERPESEILLPLVELVEPVQDEAENGPHALRVLPGLAPRLMFEDRSENNQAGAQPRIMGASGIDRLLEETPLGVLQHPGQIIDREDASRQEAGA